MRLSLIGALIAGCVGMAQPALASVINVETLVHVALVETIGEYDNAELALWNGQPLSPTNHPTPEQDQLSADWNFYVDPNFRNKLYITVSNVQDPAFGYISGQPFYITALTGFQFTLPVNTPSYATFSGNFAVPGQQLVGPMNNTLPLDTTPGWSLASVSGSTHHATYIFESAPDQNASYAFTHYSSVSGDIRIFAGGVFQLVFAPDVDLLHMSYAGLKASASNGRGTYTEAGSRLYFYTPKASIPEPSSFVLLSVSLIALAAVRGLPRKDA